MIDMVQFCELAASGVTVQEAARQLGLSKFQVYALEKEYGVKFVRRGSMKPKRVAHAKGDQKIGADAGAKPTWIPPGTRPLEELDAKRIAFESHFAPYTPTLPASATRKVGAPPTYRPEMADTLLELSAQGHTIGAIAAVLGVARGTMNSWAASHAEFEEAYARGKGLRQFMYEGHLIDMVRRGGDSTRMSAVKLGLLNVGGEDWKERLTADHNVTFSLAGLIQESMKVVGQTIDSTAVELPAPDTDCPTD